MKEKKCSRCKEVRPITDFWKNKTKNDGYNYVCRICYRDTDRKRYYKDVKQSRKAKNEMSRKMAEKYPDRFRARRLLRYAVKIGSIEKFPCEVCEKEKSEGHHDDYGKPLEVKWLCSMCHSDLHRIKKLQKINDAN